MSLAATDTLGWLLAAGLVGLAALAAAMVISHVWAAATGRRTEGMDEAYDARPCAACGYDLRASGPRCPECGAAQFDRRRYLRRLAEDWPAAPVEPRRPDPGEGPAPLLSTPDADEADLLRDQLEARGIAATTGDVHFGGDLVSNRPPDAFTRVVVFAGDLPAARAYLRRARGLEDGDEAVE